MKNQGASNREFIIIDFLRLFLICAVVTIHTGAPWFVVAIGRIGVPFSFALTGFFTNSENVEKSIKRNLSRLLIWICIYSPLIIGDGTASNMGAIYFLQQLLFITPCYLWFLTALIVCLILYKFMIKVPNHIRIIISFVLYVIGCCGNTYLDIFHFGVLYEPYLSIFLTVRNGVFFAPIFFEIGQWIKHSEYDRMKSINTNVISLIMLVSMYFAEYWFLNNNPLVYKDASMYFFLPPLVYTLLRFAIIIESLIGNDKKIKLSGKAVRQLSTWIYVSQAYFIRIFVRGMGGDCPKTRII